LANEAGKQVDHVTKAFSEEELLEKLPNYHAIGIRSKTKITAKVINACSQVNRVIYPKNRTEHKC